MSEKDTKSDLVKDSDNESDNESSKKECNKCGDDLIDCPECCICNSCLYDCHAKRDTDICDGSGMYCLNCRQKEVYDSHNELKVKTCYRCKVKAGCIWYNNHKKYMCSSCHDIVSENDFWNW